MSSLKSYIKSFLCTFIIILSFSSVLEVASKETFNTFKVKILNNEEVVSIEKNNDLITTQEKEGLNEIINKLNKYRVLSQEERDYIQECELNVIRKKLGEAQFEEYRRLIEKRSSGAEFQQPERFRLYELEKMLR